MLMQAERAVKPNQAVVGRRDGRGAIGLLNPIGCLPLPSQPIKADGGERGRETDCNGAAVCQEYRPCNECGYPF